MLTSPSSSSRTPVLIVSRKGLHFAWLILLALAALFALALRSPAAEATRKNFKIATGEARVTLPQFSAQSGEQILFSEAAAAGVRTNAVSGSFTSAEALQRMLSGTGLVSAYDEQTGAIAIRRKPAKEPDGDKPPAAGGKRSAEIGNGDATGEEALILNAFEVTATAGRGYVARNTEGGLRTGEPMFKMPQGITVLTRDFIDDLAYSNSSDILRFGGTANFFQGESISLRGSRVSNPAIDGAADSQPYVDNVFVDSYEVLKGPIGGSVNRNPKRPLRVAQHSVTVRFDEHGMYRGEADLTGPIGRIGESQFSYRLVGAYQDGDTFLKFREDERRVLHPTLQLNYRDTIVRLAGDFQFLRRHPNSNNFLTTDGKLFTGAGRDEGYFAPGGMEDFKRTAGRLTILQRFSPNWDFELEFDAQRWNRYGIALLAAGGVNWRDRTVGFISRQNAQDYEVYNMRASLVGQYRTGPMVHRTWVNIRGGQYIAESRFWASGQSFRRSIDNPQMETVVLPARYSIPRPAAAGDRVKIDSMSTNLRHSVDLYDRVYLQGSLTYGGNETTTRTNIADPTAPVTSVRLFSWPYTLSVSLKVIESISLYASESHTSGRQFQRDINGNQLPDQTTVGRDVGLKFQFRQGQITAYVAAFDTETTNQAVFGGITPGGVSYSIPVGTTRLKGWEGDITAAITDHWQILVTGFKGETKDINGRPLANSYTGSWSLFTRYDFSQPALKGLSIGGGGSRVDGRIVARSGVTFPVGQTPPTFITLDPAILVNAFVGYRYKQWTFRLNVENVLDKAFPMGAQNAWIVDPSTPRTFSFSTTMRF